MRNTFVVLVENIKCYSSSRKCSILVQFSNPNPKQKKIIPSINFFFRKNSSPYSKMDADQALKLYPLTLWDDY